MSKRKGVIRTTYEIVTPESADYGDAAERGWEDEEGEKLQPGRSRQVPSRQGRRQTLRSEQLRIPSRALVLVRTRRGLP